MFEKIKKWYESGMWTKKMVRNAVIKGNPTEKIVWTICDFTEAPIFTKERGFTGNCLGLVATKTEDLWEQVELLQLMHVSLSNGFTVAMPFSYFITRALSRIKISGGNSF